MYPRFATAHVQEAGCGTPTHVYNVYVVGLQEMNSMHTHYKPGVQRVPSLHINTYMTCCYVAHTPYILEKVLLGHHAMV